MSEAGDRTGATGSETATAHGRADMINSPPHYRGAGGIEAIDVIEAYGLDYHRGNAVKYLIRAGRKGTAADDLRKAYWYCARWLAKAADGVPLPCAPDDAPWIDEIIAAFEMTGWRADALAAILDSARLATQANYCMRRARRDIQSAIGGQLDDEHR